MSAPFGSFCLGCPVVRGHSLRHRGERLRRCSGNKEEIFISEQKKQCHNHLVLTPNTVLSRLAMGQAFSSMVVGRNRL